MGVVCGVHEELEEPNSKLTWPYSGYDRFQKCLQDRYTNVVDDCDTSGNGDGDDEEQSVATRDGAKSK
jgi:hypothetical protein